MSCDQLNIICLNGVCGWTYRSHLGFVVAGQESSFLGLAAYMTSTTLGMGSTATLEDGVKQVCPGALNQAGESLDEEALQKQLQDCIFWRVWIIGTYQGLNHIHSSCYVSISSILFLIVRSDLPAWLTPEWNTVMVLMYVNGVCHRIWRMKLLLLVFSLMKCYPQWSMDISWCRLLFVSHQIDKSRFEVYLILKTK